MRLLLCTLLLAATARAAEVLEYLVVDGQRYESVKWGPANQGKVVIFHSRGVATLPVEKLPPEYQARFGYRPESAPVTPPAESEPQKILEAMRAKRAEPASPPQNTGEWAAYNRDRAGKVLLDGKLVDKSTLKELTGFLVKEQAQVTAEDRSVRGAVLEIAQRREEAGPANASMELRPAFWKHSGEFVWLSGYSPHAILGALLRVYAVEEDGIDGRRVFRVGMEPSFEEWQTLKSR